MRPCSNRLLLVVLSCALAPALAGCADEPAEGPRDTADLAGPDLLDTAEVEAPDAEPDAPPIDWRGPGSFRWDLGAVSAADFYAHPWPSDLRRLPNGAPDLTAFPTERALVDLLDLALREVERGSSVAEAQGFSALSSAYFGLAMDLEPASLEGRVLLVDVDPASPDFGHPLPVTAEWNGPGGGYWPARTLALHPDYQRPPRVRTRRAALLLRGIEDTSGAPLEPPALVANLELLLASASPPAEALALAPLLEVLPELGLSPEDLLAATVWTVADPMAELRALVTWLRAEPMPAPVGLTFVERRPAYDLYEGRMPMAELFSGEPPYTTFGDARIGLVDGAPTASKEVELPFALTVPRTPPPAGGYPIIVYSHGLGEDHRGFLRTAAVPLANRGVAVIGIDPPLQGARNTTGIPDRDLVIQLSIANILGGREILRQAVLDHVQLARMVARPAFAVPAEVAVDGAALAFDAAKLGFFGHSEGAQVGALLLPLTPELGPAVFSEGGGGAAITMLVLNLAELDVASAVAQALGIDVTVERWELGHPVVSVAIQPLLDAADPLHLAREVFLEPRERAHDLVMLEGFLDELTPPPSIEALASALGLPIAEPVGREIEGLTAQGIASVPLPASGNLPPRDGAAPTGALLQLPDDDHYIIYFNDAVKARLFDFLVSGLDGAAVLAP